MLVLEIGADSLAGPRCAECGETTRVIGVESHSIAKQLTVLTFECVRCRVLGGTVVMFPISRRGGRDAR
jgi:hypothetical protein